MCEGVYENDRRVSQIRFATTVRGLGWKIAGYDERVWIK
jgi:hypothetical protein